jgi:hypothetical protein
MEHPASDVNRKSARKVQVQKLTLSKVDARYWLSRLFKWQRSPNYSMQIQFKGRRMAFSLGTGNRDAAARERLPFTVTFSHSESNARLRGTVPKVPSGPQP